MVCLGPDNAARIEAEIKGRVTQRPNIPIPSNEPKVGYTSGGFTYEGQGIWSDIETGDTYNNNCQLTTQTPRNKPSLLSKIATPFVQLMGFDSSEDM